MITVNESLYLFKHRTTVKGHNVTIETNKILNMKARKQQTWKKLNCFLQRHTFYIMLQRLSKK